LCGKGNGVVYPSIDEVCVHLSQHATGADVKVSNGAKPLTPGVVAVATSAAAAAAADAPAAAEEAAMEE
jgi:hypothetical protein